VIRKLILPVVLVVIGAGIAFFLLSRRDSPAPGPGIPESLAVERARRVSDVHYEVTFRVPAKTTEPVTAHLRATFSLRDAESPLAFDFAQPTSQMLAMHANTRIIEPKVEDQHINIPARALLVGANIVEFEFIAVRRRSTAATSSSTHSSSPRAPRRRYRFSISLISKRNGSWS
jgi:hypothetical protein